MRRTLSRPAPAAGFTLVELLISMFILVLILVGVLLLFDLNSRIARAQLHLADMQQSQRIGQYTLTRMARMAGRGGLPVFVPASPPPSTYEGKLLPAGGVSLAVRNNVPIGVKLGGSDDAKVLPGTDILTVRGIFNSLVYQVQPASGAFSFDGTDGTLDLANVSPTGVPQSLEDIKRAIDTANGAGGTTEALLLISPLGEYAVVEITGGSTGVAGGVTLTARIDFKGAGGDHTDDYKKLSPNGAFPPTLATVSFAGILKEYRYYIRAPNEAGEVMPKLSRARFYPNTETAYQDDDTNLHEDIADNVIDLQLALGVDKGGVPDRVDEGDGVALQKSDDDWLFNSTDDVDPTGDVAATALWNDVTRPLYYLRVTTVARTDRRDHDYEAPPLEVIEDKDYSDSAYAAANSSDQRMYRRRILQTVVDLRNL